MEITLVTDKEIRKELMRRLRRQRLVQELSLPDLATRTALSISTLKRMETCGNCTFESLIRVVIGLGLAEELRDIFLFKKDSIGQIAQTKRPLCKRTPRKCMQDDETLKARCNWQFVPALHLHPAVNTRLLNRIEIALKEEQGRWLA